MVFLCALHPCLGLRRGLTTTTRKGATLPEGLPRGTPPSGAGRTGQTPGESGRPGTGRRRPVRAALLSRTRRRRKRSDQRRLVRVRSAWLGRRRSRCRAAARNRIRYGAFRSRRAARLAPPSTRATGSCWRASCRRSREPGFETGILRNQTSPFSTAPWIPQDSPVASGRPPRRGHRVVNGRPGGSRWPTGTLKRAMFC